MKSNKTGTTNDTWDDIFVSHYIIANKNGSIWKFLWSALELDSHEAKEMAKENVKYNAKFKKQLKEFVEKYKELRTTLKKITKKSYKF